MIQELLGGGVGGGGEDRKITVGGAGVVVEGSSSSSSSSSENQNLRCPRCDSPNTKFCYYNNYNLTQPRHFCKTCRRYWTKGGALRNVPIGGGCRKNKSTSTSNSSSGKSSASGKAIKPVPCEVGKPILGNGFDHDHTSSPLVWPSPSQNLPLLALLRATQNPNPNPNSPNMVKEERVLIGSHMGSSESTVMPSALAARNLNLDPNITQVPFSLSNSFWRNNHNQQQQLQQQQQQLLQQHTSHQNNMLFGEAPNSSAGIQDLYQRITSTTTNYYNDHSPAVLLSNASTSSSSSIMEPASMTPGQLGYWNLPFSSWSDLPTTNGAFP
ncbi:hypothetical protein ACLOJK_041832 [Asimina triloba]